ncbi:MAG: Ubiquinone/menaquinone biosynthesis C-methyltransferase UbiE [Verrucomicrobiota bacterium]|jgi:demethylmenaquinone methyltransferase/2-methoxy-6-polyprenyl-1,4-benzoquinol methylase
MFSGIASRYDFANRVLSLGLCVGWRERLVAAAQAARPQTVADLATGSGDVAFALRRDLPADCAIVGYDFCEPMLALGRMRAAKEKVALEFLPGDCMRLPIADESCDVVTIAYGVRNFEDRARGLRELCRVTKPGGSVFILEFSRPAAWFAPFHFIHVRLVSPVLAGLLTGDFAAYRYLGTSIAGFPDAAGLTQELKNVGFSEVSHESMLFGTVALHRAKK